jgi:dihydrofolate reductase
LIWAQDRKGVIGLDDGLPWRIPEDSRRFRALTLGHAVVMGRRTWDSLPARFRPLPGRENWVLTRQPDWTADGAHRAGSLDEVRTADGSQDLWVAGGGEVYEMALPRAQECFVTEIDADFDGDTWAPDLSRGWRRDDDHPASSDGQASSDAGIRFRFSVYRPISSWSGGVEPG